MHRVRLVIADRRPIVLQGLVSLLEAQPDFEVVACCLDGASCLAAIRTLTPDVVLLEDEFTDVTASDILVSVDDEGLSSRLLFFTAEIACGDLARALASGACSAISVNTKPEALLQSLRVEKPGSDLARVSKANGIATFGNNVLAVLTVNERMIMDLVAEGLSDSQIAQVHGVSLEIVKTHIDHARQKLGTNSRTELAALALSRRYGAMSILAAAILAALDDSPSHAASDSCTVVTSDGAEVVTIKFRRNEAESGGVPAKAARKDRPDAATGSSPPSKLVDPVAEIAASLYAQAALNAPRPSSSGYSIFMVAAFAALIYELDSASHVVQAFNFDGLADNVTSSPTSDANGLTSWHSAFADFAGAAAYERALAFEFAPGDTITTDGSGLYIGNAYGEHGGSDQTIISPRGSGTVDDVAAAANDASQSVATQASGDVGSNQGRSQPDRAPDNPSEPAKKHDALGDDLNYGQSQKALHESDHGSGGAKGHDKADSAGDGLNHGQAQKALHGSDNGSGAAKGHAKEREAAPDDLNHGQSQKALHDGPDSGSAAAKGHSNHEVPRDSPNSGRAHGDLQTFEGGSAAGKQHAQHREAVDLGAGKPQPHIPTASASSFHDEHSAVGTELSDSFHFKKGAGNTSSDMYELHQLSYENGIYGDSQHAVARAEPEPVQSAGGIDISNAYHDHSGHANLHAAYDLIV